MCAKSSQPQCRSRRRLIGTAKHGSRVVRRDQSLPGLIPSPGSAFELAGSVSRAESTGPDRSVGGESLSVEAAQALANALAPDDES